jgi:EmrB/QacA subfamily drug resistance transporter
MNSSHDIQFNRGILLAVIMLSSFFNPFMGSAVNIALPSIAKDLNMNAVNMSWVAMAFLLSSAVLLVPFGKLADIWGRRRMLLLGNTIFTLSTFLSILAGSGPMLIFTRFIQGIGSAMILSSGMAIAISAFPPEHRGRIIGLNTTAVYTGLSAAPLLGGILTQSFGWQSLFYINGMAGLLIIAGILTGVRHEWTEKQPSRFDMTGSLMYVPAMSALMYGFSKLPDHKAILITIAGVGGMELFSMRSWKHTASVLDMELFKKNRLFAFSNLAALINYAATFGITFLLSLYLQNVKGLSPQHAGMILVMQPVIMAIMSAISGRLSDKTDARILSSLGMIIIVVGLIMLSFLRTYTQSEFLITALAFLGFGFGLFSSPNTHSIMSSVPKSQLGTASAMLGTMRLTGQMFSMAMTTMSIHFFIGNETINPSNIPGFMAGMKTIFVAFAILCLAGAFASMARGKQSR